MVSDRQRALGGTGSLPHARAFEVFSVLSIVLVDEASVCTGHAYARGTRIDEARVGRVTQVDEALAWTRHSYGRGARIDEARGLRRHAFGRGTRMDEARGLMRHAYGQGMRVCLDKRHVVLLWRCSLFDFQEFLLYSYFLLGRFFAYWWACDCTVSWLFWCVHGSGNVLCAAVQIAVDQSAANRSAW